MLHVWTQKCCNSNSIAHDNHIIVVRRDARTLDARDGCARKKDVFHQEHSLQYREQVLVLGRHLGFGNWRGLELGKICARGKTLNRSSIQWQFKTAVPRSGLSERSVPKWCLHCSRTSKRSLLSSPHVFTSEPGSELSWNCKDLARRLHLSCKCTARTRKENLSFFSFRLKPWPNGTASRRKLKTWIYSRHRLARPCVHLGWLAMTCAHFGRDQISTQVNASFSPFGHPTQVNALMTWNKLFSEVADDHAPVKRRRVKGTPLPWMNRKISDSSTEIKLSQTLEHLQETEEQGKLLSQIC